MAVGVAGAAPRPVTAGSATPGVPSASIGVLGKHVVRFCVSHYKPNSTVTVVNRTTGSTVTIHTNAKGAGCAEVPIKRACHAVTQTIVATGTGADGTPATTRATVTAPATSSLCRAGASSGGVLPFTGSDFILPAIAIAMILIVGGTGAVTVGRRRRGLALG
jgi:hypothetical protein